MKPTIRNTLASRKRQIERRLDKFKLGDCSQPMFTARNIDYEFSQRVRGLAYGGIGLFHQLARRIGLIDAINQRLHLLKIRLGYHESDHVLNFAYNALCNGDCLQDIELRRNDAVFLDALGARRIPDPTTAGDFCRRFTPATIQELQDIFDDVRIGVWRQQPQAFFAQAILDADGTLVETTGQCKQGMDIAYNGVWGYHPLVVTLANTREVLRIVNRSGNRPSHEGAAAALDQAVATCFRGGFRTVLLRGDTDFSQTQHLDRWDDDPRIHFLFGYDAMPNVVDIAEQLPEQAWKKLARPPVFVSSADRVRGLEGGADGFLNGPVETAELVATVNALLRLRQDTGRCDATRRDPKQAEGLQLVPWPEQQFNGFLEAAPDAVVIADQNGRIIRVNAQAERLFGYPRRELLGREVEMLIPERFRERHVGQRTAYSANPSPRPMGTGQQLYGLRKDGHEFPAEISLSPLSAKDGVVIASAIRDVTEHRRMEEELRLRTRELEDAARHKDEFLGMLAHELRNPLGTIRNAIQVLKQLGPPDPNLQWARDVIGRQADHMAHLVEDLLDASRIAHGKVSIQKEPVELGQVVGQAVETCRHLLNARKQQVTVSLPSRPVPLLADPTRLVQVFTNLLNNAAKYTEDGGQIWLTATEEEGEVVVRVRDNGIGIAAEMLPRVFDLFTQVPGALDRSEGGLGIGLAMVGHLVLLHGGTVQAFSDGPGRGSEFVVRLPLLSATCAGRDGAGETGNLPTESPPRRILVADDNSDLVEAVALLLRRRGHDVCVAGDGPAALAAARTFRPEVVFLDIELPVLSDHEVAGRLRQQPGLENVLLVATTGHAEEEVQSHAHDAGFDAHLAKPYQVDTVLRFLTHGRPGGFAAPRGSAAPCAKAPFVGSSRGAGADSRERGDALARACQREVSHGDPRNEQGRVPPCAGPREVGQAGLRA